MGTRPGTLRPDSAANARPRKVYLVHGGGSTKLHDPLDLRTAPGKAARDHRADLVAHVAEPTLPELELIEQATRMYLLVRFAWAEITKTGLIVNGAVNPALDALFRASKDQREVLTMLGLKKRAKDISTLSELLAAKETPE